ncbi:MAG: lytic murein transglycosylase B [Succinivibrionaceae bacterium]|nr:lytic murein transglycosylase B [Succinivibrionaceae bacterium]
MGFSQIQAAELTKPVSARLSELSHETRVDEKVLRDAVRHAEYQPKIIEMITKPWESKPWYKYRTIFLTEKRISEGARFLRENIGELERAERAYGVEKEIIVAILGVETTYGQNMGSWKIVDALYTLGFHYPKRAKYFSKEFANYVKLARQQGWDIEEHKGSYAGAMGMAQFMPSSYLSYAVDFNNDGSRDLFHTPSDAIGSIANYFKNSKWTFGRPVAYEAVVAKRASVASLLGGKPAPNTTVGELKRKGVEIYSGGKALNDKDKVKLLELDGDEGKIYYVVYPNFVSITRYNTSPLYAMAVYQLSQEIKRRARAGRDR